MAIKEEKSLCLIASDKSITFDEGQIYVSKYLDDLLAKINNFKKNKAIQPAYGVLFKISSPSMRFSASSDVMKRDVVSQALHQYDNKSKHIC